MTLRDRVAIVTGAAGGIGEETVRVLYSRGTHVVLADLESTAVRLDRLAEEARRDGVRAAVVPTDVTAWEDVQNLARTTLAQFGRIDLLANVAGMSSTPSLCDDDDTRLERVVAVNLLGCARTMRAVLPAMKAQRSGSIVNVGSIAGEAGVMGIYSASKFGLRGLSDSVRREVRRWNVGVTLIEPGFVATSMNAAMGRLPSPRIVAEAIARAAVRPRRRIIVPAYYHVPAFVANAFPWFIDAVFADARIQERLNRDARAAKAAAERSVS